MRQILVSLILGIALLNWGVMGHTQQSAFPLQPPPSGVATLDRERLFQESNFGKSLLADIDNRSRILATENRSIEESLENEERALTELRKQITPEEFRKQAIDFDVKVKQTRAEQEAKLTQIRSDLERARSEFLTQVDPVLQKLMAEQGIAVIVDKNAVLYAITDIDITDDAILRVNQVN